MEEKRFIKPTFYNTCNYLQYRGQVLTLDRSGLAQLSFLEKVACPFFKLEFF